MPNYYYPKVFFNFSLFAVILFLIYLSVINVTPKKFYDKSDVQDIFKIYSDRINTTSANKKLIYILEWTSPKTEPFIFLGNGRGGFQRRHCEYTNCFVTSDRSYLQDVTKFDVILFHGPEINRNPSMALPSVRSPHQKYVYASMESSHYYPICSKKFDNFFNWTWTFRLDSDARWGYILVTDTNGTIIGPNKVMHWMKIEDMAPIDEVFKQQLKRKRKAAAWFVSNCKDLSGRKKFADKLKIELEKYNLELDVYGACGSLKCPRDKVNQCVEKIKDMYYFYLAFENSFSEDYVTEKLLLALNNDAVPVVYGGANYSRFMPDGIYLNARELQVEKLAAKMNELILDPEKYAQYFKWKNHYSFHSREEEESSYNEYCGFCALLNDRTKINNITVIDNFRDWWNPPIFCTAHITDLNETLFYGLCAYFILFLIL